MKKELSRQRRWQDKMAKAGRCRQCGAPAIKTRCDLCAKKKGVKKRQLTKEEWSKINWSLTNREIASMINMSYQCVINHRPAQKPSIFKRFKNWIWNIIHQPL